MNKKIPLVSVKLVKEKSLPFDKDLKIESPEDAYEILKDLIKNSDRELFVVIAVDTANHPSYIEIVSKGTVNYTVASPREIFKNAIISNSSKLILAHNHPSGDYKPSLADLETTRRLLEVGNIIGIPVLDHIIIGDNGFCSIQREGILKMNSSVESTLDMEYLERG